MPEEKKSTLGGLGLRAGPGELLFPDFESHPSQDIILSSEPWTNCMYLNIWCDIFECKFYKSKVLFSSLQNSKILQDSLSHRIFQRMHEVLNVAK